MDTPQSILRVLQQGQWLTCQDMKYVLFHILFQGLQTDITSVTTAVDSTAIRVVN